MVYVRYDVIAEGGIEGHDDEYGNEVAYVRQWKEEDRGQLDDIPAHVEAVSSSECTHKSRLVRQVKGTCPMSRNSRP